MFKLEGDLGIIGFSEQLTPVLRAATASVNDLYVGTVAIPQLNRRIHAYVKIFPPAHRGLCAYNEIIAHNLSAQCALSMPPTFLCACRLAQLRSTTRGRMAGDSSSGFVTGIASLDVSVRGIQQAFSRSDAAVAEIMTWPEVARLAVFDELLANDDRHLENLIRQGPARYMAVDNERILFGEPWFDMDLSGFEHRSCEANVLAATIAEGPDQLIRQRMARIAQQLILGTTFAVPMGADVLEQRCSAPAGVTTRLIDMLNKRRLRLSSLMQWHLRKGDLFQESFKK